MECPYCTRTLSADAPCSACGYPSGSDAETRRQFLYRKLLAQQTRMDDTLNTLSKTKFIFYFAALLSVFQIIGMCMDTHDMRLLIPIAIFGIHIAAGFVYLGIAIERNPLLYASIGMVASIVMIGIGGLFGLAMLAGVAYTLYSAVEYKRRKKEIDRLQSLIDRQE